jgi:hypothetical protein
MKGKTGRLTVGFAIIVPADDLDELWVEVPFQDVHPAGGVEVVVRSVNPVSSSFIPDKTRGEEDEKKWVLTSAEQSEIYIQDEE